MRLKGHFSQEEVSTRSVLSWTQCFVLRKMVFLGGGAKRLHQRVQLVPKDQTLPTVMMRSTPFSSESHLSNLNCFKLRTFILPRSLNLASLHVFWQLSILAVISVLSGHMTSKRLQPVGCTETLPKIEYQFKTLNEIQIDDFKNKSTKIQKTAQWPLNPSFSGFF